MNEQPRRILDRPEFNDPEQLQELFRKGVEEFKEVCERCCCGVWRMIERCWAVAWHIDTLR